MPLIVTPLRVVQCQMHLAERIPGLICVFSGESTAKRCTIGGKDGTELEDGTELAMIVNKIFSLVLMGCVAAICVYAVRNHARRREQQQHRDDLNTWEAEGGNPAPATARACDDV